MSAFGIFAAILTFVYVIYYAVMISMDLFGNKSQQKDNVEENLAIGSSKHKTEMPALEENKDEPGKLENVIMGTGNVAKMLQEKKKQALIAKFQEVKDEEK